MILYAITTKYMSMDANGIPDYVWATKSQVKKIIQMRNNPDKRSNFIRIGKWTFSPMDIVKIEEKNTEHYGGPIPSYARKRYIEDQKEEEQAQLKSGTPKINYSGLERLRQLKAGHSL